MRLRFQLILAAFVLTATGFPGLRADAVEMSGWSTMASEVVGDDALCGAGLVKHELVVRNLDSGDQISVNGSIFRSRSKSTDAIYDGASGSGPTIGPICFNPDDHYLEMYIDGGSSYYDYISWNEWKTPGSVPREKLMRTTIWVRPTSNAGFDYRHVSPVNVVMNLNPDYELQLSNYPTTYGATEVSTVKLAVFNWLTGDTVISTDVALGGGNGLKTLPTQGITDGIFVWGYYVKLNGSHDAGGGFTPIQELSSGYSWVDTPFMLDRTAPTIDTASYSPMPAYETDPVTITGNVSDSLAGISEIRVYLDGVLVNTCAFASVASAACSFTAGLLPAGSVHTYQIEATDGAGNIIVGALQNFTVGTTGQCGIANGSVSAFAPVAFPVAVPNNICQSGTPSVIMDMGGSFDWTCDGSDGVPATADDRICTAVKVPQPPTALLQVKRPVDATYTSGTYSSATVGDTLEFDWTTSFADACTIFGYNWPIESVSVPAGTKSILAGMTSDYTLDCTGPGGATQSVVRVDLSCAPTCGAWGACSVTCGNGTQSRSCVAADCSVYSDNQVCNLQGCSGGNWLEVTP